LYPKTGGAILPNSEKSALDIILWLLYYSDGSMSLYDISKKLNVDVNLVYKEAKQLENKNIIEKLDEQYRT
jgi:predicted transcriptional regulator